MPEHVGVLGASNGDVHDFGEYLYEGVRVLRGAVGKADGAAG